MHFGDDELKRRVGAKIVQGKARVALAVSEPTAGSDVANLKTTAKDMGDYWLVNGLKKWITCGMFADYFTVAARTGEPGSGMAGIELIVVERTMEGVTTTPMDCMGAKGVGLE